MLRCQVWKVQESPIRSRPTSNWTAWRWRRPQSHSTGVTGSWTAPLQSDFPPQDSQRESKMNIISAAADRLQFTWTSASSFSFCASAWKNKIKKKESDFVHSTSGKTKKEKRLWKDTVHTCAYASSSTVGGEKDKKLSTWGEIYSTTHRTHSACKQAYTFTSVGFMTQYKLNQF